jgi:proteasome lid subunit RPN8/RPN11
MARKRNDSNAFIDERLPQNIQLIGESDSDSKKTVYILQSAYKEIHRFAQGKTTVESGGMLVGRTVEQFGKTSIIIYGFLEAKHAEATSNTLKFTHETWSCCHKEMAKKYTGQKIVGWIHTHPNFGIFLSEYDEFIQSNFFKDENQIAYVVDPIQNIEGIYIWRENKITRASGFFVFDKTGEAIASLAENREEYEPAKSSRSSPIAGIAIGSLFLAVFLLTWQMSDMNEEIAKLQNQQKTIVNAANLSLSRMEQKIIDMQAELDAMQALEYRQRQETNPVVPEPQESEVSTQSESTQSEVSTQSESTQSEVSTESVTTQSAEPPESEPTQSAESPEGEATQSEESLETGEMPNDMNDETPATSEEGGTDAN